MSKSKPSKKNSTERTVSSYNLFYTLERQLFLKENGIPSSQVKHVSEDDWKNYGDLSRLFPTRPSRYKSLDLPDTWFIKRTSRSRNRSTKNQDAICLEGLSKAIASSWKTCDAEVKGYVTTVAEMIKKRCNEILPSKSGTKSTSPRPSIGLKTSDLSPKFEPAIEDEQNVYGRRVSMISSASSISIDDVPYVVHNAGIHQQLQQLDNLYATLPSSLKQQMILPYLNIRSDVIGRSIGISDAHQSKKSAHAMASDPESTCFSSQPLSEGPYVEAIGQHENMSYPTVEKLISEEGSDWEEEVSLQDTEEDAGFESFLHQDPNQCGWLQSDYFKNDVVSISGPDMSYDKEREYAVDHYIPEGASQPKKNEDLKAKEDLWLNEFVFAGA